MATPHNPYPYRKVQYQKQLEKLEAWNGNLVVKGLILQYADYLFSKGDGENTVTKRLSMLRRTFEMTDKEPSTLSITDVQRMTSQINRELKANRRHVTEIPLSEASKADYRKELRRFLVWYENFDPRLRSPDMLVREETREFYKYARKNLSGAYRKPALDYSGIITDEDFKKLIREGCKDTKQRAVMATLFHTGVRSTELLNMRVKDIETKGSYGMIRVDGKTGERRVPVLEAMPFLIQHVKEHPDRENPDALLWLREGYRDKPLLHNGLALLLRKIFRRAGVRKKCNPHWLRHSRATLWGPHYSEAVLCKMMGWKIGSAQVQTYVHLGAAQVESAFLKANKLAEETPKEPELMLCTVCKTQNSTLEDYCHTCFRPLKMVAAIEGENKREDAMNQALRMFKEALKDPEELKRFLDGHNHST